MPSFAITNDLDPRLTPAREDLAASWLKDHVQAARYVEPKRQQIITSVASLYRSPDSNQSIETQLLYGEPIDVLEDKDGWSWVQSTCDGYVGYLRSEFAESIKGNANATHRVANIGSFVFPHTAHKEALQTKAGAVVTPGTSYKMTPQMPLSYGSLIRIVSQKEVMSEMETGGFIPTAHLAPVDFFAEDHVAEAFRFLGVPYLWGGRSHTGIDCSGLIQLVLQACNIKCPRDSDMQEAMPGKTVERHDIQSGDLVFFRGNHVGLMVDSDTMIHANDRAMAVSIDDLDEYSTWRAKSGKAPVKMFKRI